MAAPKPSCDHLDVDDADRRELASKDVGLHQLLFAFLLSKSKPYSWSIRGKF